MSTPPTLHARLEAIYKQSKNKKRVTRYAFPPCLTNIARLLKYAARPLAIRREELQKISNVECMRKIGKSIFGSGLLLADNVVKHLEELDKSQVKKDVDDGLLIDVRLSDEEQTIVDELNRRAAAAQPLPPLPPL